MKHFILAAALVCAAGCSESKTVKVEAPTSVVRWLDRLSWIEDHPEYRQLLQEQENAWDEETRILLLGLEGKAYQDECDAATQRREIADQAAEDYRNANGYPGF